MNKKLFLATCFGSCFFLGCATPIKKQDILRQAQEIKESTHGKKESVLPPALPEPEKLVYKAKYVGITIGEFILLNKGHTNFRGRHAYCLEVQVKTLPFFARLFNTKDRYVSYMDAQKFVVLRHEEYIKGGKFLESAVDFDYEHKIATYQNFVTHKGKTVPIPNQLLDVISGGFYLRIVPWHLGETVDLNIYADEKIYNYIGLLQSKTTVNLPPYGNQEAYLLKPYVFLNGKQITKVSADVYFSAPPCRKAMRAVLRCVLGSAAVVLSEGFQTPEPRLQQSSSKY